MSENVNDEKIIEYCEAGFTMELFEKYKGQDVRFYTLPLPESAGKTIKNRPDGCYVIDKYDDFNEEGEIYTLENKQELVKEQLEIDKLQLKLEVKNNICNNIAKYQNVHDQLNNIQDLLILVKKNLQDLFTLTIQDLQTILLGKMTIEDFFTKAQEKLQEVGILEKINKILDFTNYRDEVLSNYAKEKEKICSFTEKSELIDYEKSK